MASIRSILEITILSEKLIVVQFVWVSGITGFLHSVHRQRFGQLFTGPNRVGVPPPSPEAGNPVIPSVVHHRQILVLEQGTSIYLPLLWSAKVHKIPPLVPTISQMNPLHITSNLGQVPRNEDEEGKCRHRSVHP
jgi:hypothetical protein